MADCVFCQILEGRAEGSVVYRDERAIVLLDLFPVREAHCLVIPVQHQPLLQDLEPDLCAHLFELARRTIRAHKRAGLDVLVDLDPPIDHRISQLENVIITPHTAFFSQEAVLELEERAAGEVVSKMAVRGY